MNAASTAGLAIALLCGCLGKASAESAFSGSLTMTSDYRFRGVSQNAGQITPQAEIDWNGPNSWSVGAFVSKVNFQDHQNTSFELDVFGGKRLELGWGTLDFDVSYYGYPDHEPTADGPRYSSLEIGAKLTHEWDALSASAAVSWSPNFLGNGEALDFEAGATRDLAPWLRVSGHAGRQWTKDWDRDPGGGFPYSYADIGATATKGKLSLDLRYEATSLSKPQCLLTQGGRDWCQGTFVLTLAYAMGSN
jgi:uncharacterized protein (TIGR02001 family)